MLRETIENQILFSAHEHIGSLTSFGFRPDPLFPSDVTPDLQPGRTGLVELLFSPYLASLMFENGAEFPLPENMTDEKKRSETIKTLLKIFRKTMGTGLWESLTIALRDLYETDLATLCNDDAEIIRIDSEINANYSDYFKWFEEVMQKSKTAHVLKPVHPEFMVRTSHGEGQKELKYTYPILRVDSLIGFPDKSKVIDFGGIAEASGIEITDFESLENGIKWFFDLVDSTKCRAIKQLQAYYRPIGINQVTREEAENALDKALAARKTQSKLPKETLHALQDYIMHRILEEADKRNLPYQIHTGMTTLKNSNPALLEGLFKKYPNVKFVLLHAYPFAETACYLARTNPNVYLDTSWQALQSSSILEKCLEEWIGMVPYYKITASVDATNLEEYYGGQVMTKRILSAVLSRRVDNGQFDESTALETAQGILCENAKRLYMQDK